MIQSSRPNDLSMPALTYTRKAAVDQERNKREKATARTWPLRSSMAEVQTCRELAFQRRKGSTKEEPQGVSGYFER